MKHFFVQNWYKLITATSILFISLSCFIYSISNLFATPYSQTVVNSKALSHLNSDGSINVKLSDDQLRKISQYNEIQKVNIVQLRGKKIGKVDYTEELAVLPIVTFKRKIGDTGF